MRRIQYLIDQICDELECAKEYAESYIEAKSSNDQAWATRYKEMANDELKHAMYIHEKALYNINEIGKVFTAPENMQNTWDKSHKKYVEHSAWIKQMLTM